MASPTFEEITEYHLVRKVGASGEEITLQEFNSGTELEHSGAALFICRYDGHVYRIDSDGEDCWVVGISTPPDVIDGGTW